MQTAKVNYSITLDETKIIKAFAIMAMLFHHLFYESSECESIKFVLVWCCKICVALFVFLSGYGMAASFPKISSNPVKKHFFFLCKRYTKFFLNYWFVFFMVVPVGVLCFGRSLRIAYGENANLFKCFVSDMLGQQIFNSYNITWWFNALILALWFLFPLIHWLMNMRIVSICVIMLLIVCPQSVLNSLDLVGYGVSRYLLTFSIGVFLALHQGGVNRILNHLPLPFILVGTTVVGLFLIFSRGRAVIPNFSGPSVDPYAAVFTSLAVVSLCRITKRRFVVMQYIGKHSMNVYLIHAFIFAYFFHDFIYGFKYPVLIFLALFATSLLLSICIELIKNRIGFYKLQSKIVGIINRAGGLVPKEHDNAH